jgi:hypothetical protein
MKMVKSLLLGSAAGIVAIASAQAADLPVKAKAVEYVKVCSLYGAGFYYMPGTDTCLKVGGYIRAQYENGAWAGGQTAVGAQGIGSRETRGNVAYRIRGDVSLDARTQTAYGTVRSYARFGGETNDAVSPNVIHYDRAFIQFAGFTFGKTQSFYDFLSLAPYNYSAPRIGSDTGAAGVMVAAYTAQFGNGLSATVSLEQPRNAGFVDLNGPTFGNAHANAKAWDVVGNVRVDQAWGSAQIMASAHNASADYFSAANPGLTNHPSDKWGYAVGAGIQLNVPGMKGDIIAAQVNYAKGAANYVYFGAGGNAMQLGALNADSAFGNVADGVFSVQAGEIDLTTAWGVAAVYQHLWSPALRTSIYGGYTDVNYPTTVGPASVLAGDFSFYQVGTRTAWFPHPDLELGLDVMYTKLNTMNEGTLIAGAQGAVRADQDIVSTMFRVQRNFLP